MFVIITKKGDNKMLFVIKTVLKNGLDYILKDGTELYTIDWDGEKYTNGYKDHKDTDKTYRPVCEKNEIIAFEVF